MCRRINICEESLLFSQKRTSRRISGRLDLCKDDNLMISVKKIEPPKKEHKKTAKKSTKSRN